MPSVLECIPSDKKIKTWRDMESIMEIVLKPADTRIPAPRDTHKKKKNSPKQKQKEFINNEMIKYGRDLYEEEAFISAWERENPDIEDLDELWDEMISTYEPIYLEWYQELSYYIPVDNFNVVPYSISYGLPLPYYCFVDAYM